jgi:hypothetical protein
MTSRKSLVLLVLTLAFSAVAAASTGAPASVPSPTALVACALMFPQCVP